MAALFAVGVAGAMRSPSSAPRARSAPSPTPSESFTAGWTEYPPAERADEFEVYVGAHRPPTGRVAAMILDRGVPVFVINDDDAISVYEAIGGPSHAPTLLGWCARNRTLQDPAGTWSFRDGLGPPGTAPPRAYPVRESTAVSHVDIGVEPAPAELVGGTVEIDAPPCRANELVMPPLPGLSNNSGPARHALARMRGTFTVTTEARTFCPARDGAPCVEVSWTDQEDPRAVLPEGDLAGAYVWEGEFLVRAVEDRLTVVLLPSTRLVRRDAVGTAVRAGWAESFYDRGGVLHLRFNPFATRTTPDDSPPGRAPRLAAGGAPGPGWKDVRGGLVDYAVRPDAQVSVSLGSHGLPGLDVLRTHLKSSAGSYAGPPLWLVLDEAGRVMRVVSHRPTYFARY